jgi:NADPH:quinone reductase-like Zn-dependent oxidoreductase
LDTSFNKDGKKHVTATLLRQLADQGRLRRDFIFDAVGKSSFKQCKLLLKKNGTYISTELGKNSENIFLALITPLLGGKKVLFPIPTIKKEDVIFLKKLVESDKYKPLVDRHFPLIYEREIHRDT